MAFCRNCGAELSKGKRFCAECGAPAEEAPVRAAAPAQPLRQRVQREYASRRPKGKRKSLFRRWWFWLLVLAAAATLWNRAGGSTEKTGSAAPGASAAAIAPRSTPRPSARPVEKTEAAEAGEAGPETPVAPEDPPAAGEESLSPAEIRPEFKEYLDSYEDFMDEYIEFMQQYQSADASAAALMLYDYSRLLTRCGEFSEKLDAMDESDYTQAEWAYYLEVTNRVNQKLLRALG